MFVHTTSFYIIVLMDVATRCLNARLGNLGSHVSILTRIFLFVLKGYSNPLFLILTLLRLKLNLIQIFFKVVKICS